MTNLSAYERETIINFNESEETGSICTHNKRLIARLNKACQKAPEHFKFIKTNEYGFMFYEAPKKYITIHIPVKSKMTDGQKEDFKQRMKALKSKQLQTS
jgi:hypothetical protein